MKGVLYRMEEILLHPVGYIRSTVQDVDNVPIGGQSAVIEVLPQYADALLRIEEHSHIWVFSWFHKARRDVMTTIPARVNPDLPPYGVFGLRAPVRPNPIGQTLAHLLKVEGNLLHVRGIDAVDGTPVIDIKPYYEQDIVFSPLTPDIRPSSLQMRREIFLKEALAHHQEECGELLLAVRMALMAEERLRKLNSPDIFVRVTGSPCLADVIQGLTRARLSNPPRFDFEFSDTVCKTWWKKEKQVFTISLKQPVKHMELLILADEDFLEIKNG